MNMKKLFAGIVLLALTLGAASTQYKSRGTVMAPITLDLYSDYQCPFCKDFYENTLVPLVADYVDKGKVYLVHHEFPMAMHPYATKAACYASAAARVGKYDQVCDVLFRQQNTWGTTGKVEETVASVLTPDEAKKVHALANDPAILAEVQKEIEAGKNAKVEGPPTMIITYRNKQYPIVGAVKYDMLRRFIDQLLESK